MVSSMEVGILVSFVIVPVPSTLPGTFYTHVKY